MLVIGLTGGIGSGKSSVTELFAKHGVPILDADIIARELTEPDQPAFMDIVDHFEEQILLSNGTLDRAKLRNAIFNDPSERRWLENLLHPLILDKIREEIKKMNDAYCIVAIPLLFEGDFFPFVDRVLVVDTPEDLQIERVKSRDRISDEDIQAILKTQAERGQRLAGAHDVITNDGVLADLIPQVDRLHEKYLEMSKQKADSIQGN